MRIQVNLGESRPGWLRSSRQLGYIIRSVLSPLIDANLVYLCQFNVPLLYESGVRYEREPPGTMEEFAGIPVILSRGWGDCDDLASWRVAELRKAGERATVRITWQKAPKGRLYHVLVRRYKYEKDDPRSVEDPSALLGMRGSA